MSDVEEPPSKMCKMDNEEHLEEHLDIEEEMGEGQEEWLSEGVLTDDDYNQEMEQESLDPNLTDMGEQSQTSRGDETPDLDDSTEQLHTRDQEKSWTVQAATEQANEALKESTLDVQDSIELQNLLEPAQNSNGLQITSPMVKNEIKDLEEALNSFEVKNELVDELDAFLIRKTDGKVIGKDMKSELKEVKQENHDGNDTDELLRLLGDDDNKMKKKVLVKKSSKPLVQEAESTDDEFSYENAASVTTLQVARGALIKGRPAPKALPEEASDGEDYTGSSDEARTVNNMFGVPGKRAVASKSTAKPPASQPKPSVSQTTPPGSQRKLTVSHGKILDSQGKPLVTTSKTLTSQVNSPAPQGKPPVIQGNPIVKHVVQVNSPGKAVPPPVKQYSGKNNQLNSAAKPAWKPASYKLDEKPATLNSDSGKIAPKTQSTSAMISTKSTLKPDSVSKSGVTIKSDVIIKSETIVKSESATHSEPAIKLETAKKSEGNLKSDGSAKPAASMLEETEEIDDEEFLEDEEDFDLDEEEFAEESEPEVGVRRQRIMRPERMDEEMPSDADSHSEDGSLYDEVPSSDSEDADDWFTLDIRTERASDYLPFLGPKAREFLLEEKKRVSARLATLRQSLSALTESGRKQAEQLRQATMALAELDDMLKAT